MMFQNCSQLLHNNLPRLHYGVAVSDVDGDGAFEFFVAGFGCANAVYKWNGTHYLDIAEGMLADSERLSIGVACADMNSDGREEIYILNTDSFAGRKRFADRLLQFHNGQWRDLFMLPENGDALNLTAGRSVACIDREGTERYGFVVANYGGPMRCYELDENGFLADVAPYLGLAHTTCGRSLVALPLVTAGMDIFAGNENGANFLFANQGDGTFQEEGELRRVQDAYEHARGIAVLDAPGDGRSDIERDARFSLVIGNWEGPHRLLQQDETGAFADSAPLELAFPSRVRTVIAADFDNDGYQEIFFNNIGEPNRLFGWREGTWIAISIGDAIEPTGLGTGAGVADLDGDGRLELLIAHGESGSEMLTLYQTGGNPDPGRSSANHWLRVLPLTAAGAPARGSVVTLHTADRIQRRAIDAGSGYLCQMEPVAHFGLGSITTVEKLVIRWTDGAMLSILSPAIDALHRVPHPASVEIKSS